MSEFFDDPISPAPSEPYNPDTAFWVRVEPTGDGDELSGAIAERGYVRLQITTSALWGPHVEACGRCGALVFPMLRETHDIWHAEKGEHSGT